MLMRLIGIVLCFVAASYVYIDAKKKGNPLLGLFLALATIFFPLTLFIYWGFISPKLNSSTPQTSPASFCSKCGTPHNQTSSNCKSCGNHLSVTS